MITALTRALQSICATYDPVDLELLFVCFTLDKRTITG